MIWEHYEVDGRVLGAQDVDQKYGWSHLYYCTVCGYLYGRMIAKSSGLVMSYKAIEGVCVYCLPPSRWSGVPGGIPRFDPRRYEYPYGVVKYQFYRELEYAESLICPTTPSSHPSLSPESTSSSKDQPEPAKPTLSAP